ncbi:G patch domain-containing protein 8 [Phlyctochytrium bullatum]|nr:G patch domain-containing protein 8 [Phlyctochytrium bullatum]
MPQAVTDADLLDLHEGLGLHDEDDETPRAGLEVPLNSGNLGFRLLQKMGWKQGLGLGKDGSGRVDPVPIHQKFDTSGVGKDTQMNEAHVESTAKRKALESEVIADETEEQRILREAKVMKAESVKEEIKAVTAAFYCSICDKQYSKTTEYETHLSSYDHHHRKRFKEMKEMERNNAGQAAHKKAREDKERAREEKELQRLQAAALAKAKPKPLEGGPTPHAPAASGPSTAGAGAPAAPTSTPFQKPAAQKISFSFGAKPATGGIKFSLNKK